MKKIIINSKIGKAQIEDRGKSWFIKSIPVTVDNAKMNGITYRAQDNQAGMDSLLNKPVTGGHPKKDGRSVSVNEMRRDFYLGGDIVNRYNKNGVNYVDAEFNKALMLANEQYGAYFTSKLEKREQFGVSTGLELNPVTNEQTGEIYATNQQYDHLAFLHDNEPPAGGSETVARFNFASESDEVMVINIEDHISDEETLVNRVVAKISAIFGNQEKSRYNQDDQQTNQINEGDAMRTELIAKLKANGIEVDTEITDAELLAKYEESLKAKAVEQNTDSALLQAIAGLTGNMADMKKEVAAMKDAKATDEEEEKKKKAKIVAGNALFGLSESDALALTTNALDTLYSKSLPVSGNAAGGFSNNAAEDEVF